MILKIELIFFSFLLLFSYLYHTNFLFKNLKLLKFYFFTVRIFSVFLVLHTSHCEDHHLL